MSVKIIFKEENEELFWEQWNKFVDSKNLSIRYLETNIKHLLTFFEDLYGDKSFVYLENNEPLACVFLPIEKDGESLSMSLKGGYLDAPIASDERIQKKVFTIIDEIAKENKVSKIKFAIDVLSGEKFNYLIKYGYLDSSILTYIFDLSKDLLLSCRKGHKSDIKTALKDDSFKTFFVDKDNYSEELFKEYVNLHHKCSGRITRPQITFDMQFEKIKAGKAFLVGLEYQERNVAFVYLEHNADKAIYASAADDPDYDKLQLYHILIFRAMEYLKERGIRAVDTGQPSCPSSQFDYYIDKKQANIALFKRGFGGYFKENFRGIKYFSEEAFRKDAKIFIDSYLSDSMGLKNKKIVAIVEARMTSTRLPGKVLMPLAGKPALARMIDNIKKSKYVNEIVVATTINQADDPIVELAKQNNVKFFRGSEMDVLGRVVGAAQSVNVDIIVELTGDCPLMDWRLIDRGVEEFFSGDYNCATNVIKRSFPDGFDVQVYPASLLAEVAGLTDDPLDREHVSRYIYHHEEKYKINHWFAPKEYFWPELRVTLDEINDYELINAVFEKLLPNHKDFSYIDVMELFKKFPDLLKINENVKAKEI